MSVQSVLFDAPGPRGRVRNTVIGVVGVVVCLGLLAVLLYGLRAQLFVAPPWLRFLEPVTWTSYVIPGLLATLQAAIISMVAASVVGVVLGLGRLSHVTAVRWVCGVLVEFFRAVPVLMMMLFFYSLFLYNGILSGYLLPLVSVILGLTFYNGAVIAELIRSGVRSLPKGQQEAGWALGLNRNQTLVSILLPQAITAMLPSLLSQLVVILKDTALGVIVTYPDLLRSLQTLASTSGILVALIVAAAIYIVINFALTTLAGLIERRIRMRRGLVAPSAAPVQAPAEEDETAESVDLRP